MPDTKIERVAKVIPVLNGRDSDGKAKYLGPRTLTIHRYLLVLWVAKSTMFKPLGKEFDNDNSTYFTLYKLWQIADSFKDIRPFHYDPPIRYDRTKVAIRVYTMISSRGWATVRKKDGDTFVTITEKGDDVSEELLPDLKAYMDNVSDEKFVSKGATRYDSELQGIQERLLAINSHFEDELKTIEEDFEVPFG